MNILTFLYITAGIGLVWISAQKLEKYSVLTSVRYGMSPFLIGSTVIAFGTSAPEMLTSLFAAFENKAVMVVGNVIGSNVANIALVFWAYLGSIVLQKRRFLIQTRNFFKFNYSYLFNALSLDSYSLKSL